MKKLALFIAISLFPLSALAGQCVNCTVKHVGCSYVDQGKETCNVVMNQEVKGKPSCATGGGNNRFAIDMTKKAGQAMMSLATAAIASGKSVIIYGTGKCDVLSNYESANLIYLNQQ